MLVHMEQIMVAFPLLMETIQAENLFTDSDGIVQPGAR